VVPFGKAGAGCRGVALSTKRRPFAKRALSLKGLQKLCQKACKRAKKNLQTLGACRPWCGLGELSLAIVAVRFEVTGWLELAWPWPLAR
jgi:hypothetical protein